jgi:hypothetical protein
VLSFVIFAAVYYWIYVASASGRVQKNGFKVTEVALPSFFLTEAYNSRIRAVAANEMRLDYTSFPIQPFNWTQFQPIESAPGIDRDRRVFGEQDRAL